MPLIAGVVIILIVAVVIGFMKWRVKKLRVKIDSRYSNIGGSVNDLKREARKLKDKVKRMGKR